MGKSVLKKDSPRKGQSADGSGVNRPLWHPQDNPFSPRESAPFCVAVHSNLFSFSLVQRLKKDIFSKFSKFFLFLQYFCYFKIKIFKNFSKIFFQEF